MMNYNKSLLVWLLSFFMTIVYPVATSAQPTEGPLTRKTETVEGFIDDIEFTESSLIARGWAACNGKTKINKITVQQESLIVYSGEFRSELRPDVAKAFKRVDWLDSGWLIQTKYERLKKVNEKNLDIYVVLDNDQKIKLNYSQALIEKTNQKKLSSYVPQKLRNLLTNKYFIVLILSGVPILGIFFSRSFRNVRKSLKKIYLSERKIEISFLGLLTIGALIYFLCSFSPSSYPIFLKTIQSKDGLVLGEPRGIRSDEWAVTTPTWQICKNNKFERFNRTSPYKEDLRCNLSFPIFDWGLIFKPYFLLFFLSPAYGASFFWAFFFWLFIVGFYYFFRALSFSVNLSIIGSITIFSSSFVQIWWSSFGPWISYLPWIFLINKMKLNPIYKSILLTYVLSSWIILFFYPGFLIPALCFLALLTCQNSKDIKQNLRNNASFLIATIGAGLISYTYLYDWIEAIKKTSLIERNILGGDVPLLSILYYLFPQMPYLDNFSAISSMTNYNTCEASVLGANIFLLSFLTSFRKIISAAKKYKYLFLFSLLILAYQYVSLPNILGKILFFNKCAGMRLSFLVGIFFTIISLDVLKRSNFEAVFCGLVKFYLATFCYFVFKYTCYLASPNVISFEIKLFSFLFLLVTALLILFLKTNLSQATMQICFLFVFCLFNSFYFLRFNPVSRSTNIFNIETTQKLLDLAKCQGANKNGYLVESGYPGSILNGLGFRSIAHSLFTPQLKFFEFYRKTLDEKDFLSIFGRWGYIHITDDNFPTLLNEIVILVPRKDFY